MKRLILPALIIGAIAVSCSKKETQTTDNATTEQVEAKNENVSTYEGTIPCADCSGIETKLTLNKADNTYTVDSKYLEKENGEFSDEGTFETSEDGKYITLKGKDNAGDQVYHLTDDAAYLVTEVGDTELKEEYKLSKK